jgi:hypothetical protein
MSEENPSFNFDKFMEAFEKNEIPKQPENPNANDVTQQRQYVQRYRERAYNSTRYNHE